MAENKDKKVLNVPNIRFPEFKEEWVECFLSDILEFKNGLNPKANKFGKGTKFISVMDILNNIFITYDCIKATVEATEEEKLNFSVEKGDILFQRSSETLDDVGRANVYMDERPAIFGGFVIRGKKKGEYNPLFFRYLLSSPCSRRKIIPMGAGAQHFNIGQEGLSKVKLKFASLSEQGKIGKFLSLIDERIATQNKIIDKLESLIKGIRSKLYKDLLGKELFLGDISDIYQPKTISSTELIDRGFPVYGANGIIGYYDQYNHEMEQICITCRGNTCGTINFSQQKSWITGNAMVVNTDNYKDIVDKRYLFHLLVDYNFNNIISGSGQPQIVRTPLEKIKIKLPIIDKQKQIAKSLDSILQKIDIEKYSLSLLNSQKQYLLRQMFI